MVRSSEALQRYHIPFPDSFSQIDCFMLTEHVSKRVQERGLPGNSQRQRGHPVQERAVVDIQDYPQNGHDQCSCYSEFGPGDCGLGVHANKISQGPGAFILHFQYTVDHFADNHRQTTRIIAMRGLGLASRNGKRTR
jgi:hypothetical protein